MQVSTSRGRLLLGERGRDYWSEPLGHAPPLTQPIDDVLGLEVDDLQGYGPYTDHLLRYGRFWGAQIDRRSPPTPDELLELHDERLALWQSWARDVRPRVLEAAKQAEAGHVAAVLASDLARVRYMPGSEPDEVPDSDLPALAAWCLVEALRRQPVTLGECARCGRPWIVQRGREYCQRPAPGHWRDCRTLAKEEAFLSRDEVRAYRREYKRLHELKRRGTIDMSELNAWRQSNSPAAWKPYADWIAAGRPRPTREEHVNG